MNFLEQNVFNPTSLNTFTPEQMAVYSQFHEDENASLERSVKGSDVWEDEFYPCWYWVEFEYRIKGTV